MAVNLTGGAVEKMARGEVASEKDMTPVLQVTELKLVQSKLQQQQDPSKERFRLVLSDGTNSQQGMLGTTKNDLVKSGVLQIGSIIQLTQFVCSVIQGRRIVIVVELEVIIDKYDIIGVPVPVPRPAEGGQQSSSEQPGRVIGNTQSYGGSLQPSGPVEMQNPGRPTMLHQPRPSQMYSTSNFSNPDSGRYGAANATSVYPKVDTGVGFSGSAPIGGLYGEQNMGYLNPRPETSRPPSAYVRPPQSAYNPPPTPMYTNRGPVAKNEAPPRIIPIAALNPYQGRWTIKGRITTKGELRHYNNARGDGKVFSFDLLDADGGEIRVTCFNTVADQFFDQIEAGRVYLVSRGSLKPAQKNFNHLNNEYEICLDSTSTIQPCYEDDVSIPHQNFHFRLISDIESMENNNIVDVIGIVSSISPTASIMRKNGIETQKRALQLKDTSGRSVELTMWGNFCNTEGQRLQTLCDSGKYPVLAVKAARVSDFNGKAVGTISTSQLFIDPDFPESQKLKEWFDREGRNVTSVSISREMSSVGKTDTRKTITQIKDEKLGTSEKPDWITVCATVIFMKSDNFCYTACPITIGDRLCSKKVTNNGDGKWRCDRCDQCVDECDYRYILQLQIQDHTGLTWVTAFQEAGEEIMGVSAKDLYYLKYENQDDDKFAEIIRNVVFTKYAFKLKVKEETFSDEQRVKSTVVKAGKMDYPSESRFLLDMLEKLKATDSSNINSGITGIGNVGIKHSVSPANQSGQYVNQYGGSRLSSTMGMSSGVSTGCSSCGDSGHNSSNCPTIMSGPGQYIGGGATYGNRVMPSGGGGGGGGSSGGYSSPAKYGSASRQQLGGY